MRVAFVEATSHAIKPNDIASTLAETTLVPSSWTTRKLLSENTFFVAYHSFEVVHNLLSLGQIHDEGFHYSLTTRTKLMVGCHTV